MIQIKYPIWKTRSVGIAEYKIHNGENKVEILYKNKEGERIYPHIYSFNSMDVRKYPVQEIRNGVKLRIIPISELKVHERI